jgi:hypothetical protein
MLHAIVLFNSRLAPGMVLKAAQRCLALWLLRVAALDFKKEGSKLSCVENGNVGGGRIRARDCNQTSPLSDSLA